jgi:hypothetical protein
VPPGRLLSVAQLVPVPNDLQPILSVGLVKILAPPLAFAFQADGTASLANGEIIGCLVPKPSKAAFSGAHSAGERCRNRAPFRRLGQRIASQMDCLLDDAVWSEPFSGNFGNFGREKRGC